MGEGEDGGEEGRSSVAKGKMMCSVSLKGFLEIERERERESAHWILQYER